MISVSISGLESMLIAPLQTKQMSMVRHNCDQAGLWNTLTTQEGRPPRKLNHYGWNEQSRITYKNAVAQSDHNHTHVHEANDTQAVTHLFQHLCQMLKPPFSFCKSGIVVVLEQSTGARLIKGINSADISQPVPLKTTTWSAGLSLITVCVIRTHRVGLNAFKGASSCIFRRCSRVYVVTFTQWTYY